MKMDMISSRSVRCSAIWNYYIDNSGCIILTVPQVSAALQSLQYAYPSIAFGYFMSATIASVCMRQTAALRTKDQAVRRDIIVALMVLVACTYVSTHPFNH
jgi:uncharacterized membrane protein